MFLKQLLVIANGEEVRRVLFRRGLNLIVDETPAKKSGDRNGDAEKTRTGNNVGKTTVLRCVDFCLGAKGESFYVDPEFNTTNEAVESFLKDALPEFVLDLESVNGRVTRLSRCFGEPGGRINDKELSAKDYASHLRSILFRVEGSKPTLREMTPKFIRVDQPAKHNILKWLHFGTDSQYENVWLTLFGFKQPGLLKKRLELQKTVKKLKAQGQALTQLSKSPRQERPIVERLLKKLNQQLHDMSLEGAYEGSIEQLREVRMRVRACNQRIAELEAELGNVRQTLAAIQSDAPAVDAEVLKELFVDAGRYVDGLHSDFASLLKFHKALTENKTKFVLQSEAKNLGLLVPTREELRQHLHAESVLLRKFADPDMFADVRQISDEIARLSQKKGELESLETTLRDVQEKIAANEVSQIETEAKIRLEEDSINRTLETFNSFFSDYTQRLYGKVSLVAFGVEAKKGGGKRFAFTLSHLEGHEGSGKKKALIAAFDLAYLRYQQEDASRTARFVFNDEVELIATNQLVTLFRIAESIDGQFIIPVLRDRLTTFDFEKQDQCVILELSQGDRFFRIP